MDWKTEFKKLFVTEPIKVIIALLIPSLIGIIFYIFRSYVLETLWPSVTKEALLVSSIVLFGFAAFFGFMWHRSRIVYEPKLGEGENNITESPNSENPISFVAPRGYALVKLEPNLVPFHSRVRTIDVHEITNEVLVEGKQRYGFRALVLPYRNTPSKVRPGKQMLPPGPALGVVAELSFRCFSVDSSLVVQPGVWVNECSTEIDFAVGVERNLVIATYENGELFAVERQITSAFKDGRTYRKQLVGGLIAVTVRLLEIEHEPSSFILHANGEQLELEELGRWRLYQLLELQLKALKMTGDVVDLGHKECEQSVRDWENDVVLFLSRFVSSDAAKRFKEANPSLEDAIRGKPAPGENNFAKQLFSRPLTLESYLEVRTKLLAEFEKLPLPTF